MANFLITGVAGYIGSAVAKMILESGHSVIGVDNLSTGKIEFMPHDLEFINGDISNLELMLRLGRKVDGVIHLAGIKFAGESIRNPEKFYMNNTVGTLNAALAALNSKRKFVVFSSSCSVYGNSNEEPVTENSPLLPISPYGRSKLMSETILNDLAVAHGLKVVSLRYFNVIGANHFGAFDKSEFNLFPNLCKAIRERTPVKLFGTNLPTKDGTCIRDYVDLYDVARAHVIVADKLLQNVVLKKHYNLGSAVGISVLEIVAAFQEVSNREISLEFGDHRQGDPFVVTCNYDQALEDLGWKPTVSLKESIKTQLTEFCR